MFLDLLKNVFLGSLGIFTGAILIFSIKGWFKGMVAGQNKLAVMNGLICGVILILEEAIGHFAIFSCSLFVGFVITWAMILIEFKRQKRSK